MMLDNLQNSHIDVRLTLWIDALRLDLLHDRMLSTIDRLILVIHDRTSAHSSIVSQVSCEARNGRNDNHNSEFTAFLGGANAGIDDGLANLVVNWALMFASCGD